MYTDKIAPENIRTQAQSLLVFFTQGIGMYFGYQVAFGRFGEEVSGYGDLNNAISSARTVEELSVLEQLARMFAVSMPEGLDATMLSNVMSQWKEFWIYPAMFAGVIAVVFFLTFWDKVSVTEEEGGE